MHDTVPAFREIRKGSHKYYNSADLKMFERVLQEIFEDFKKIDEYMTAPDNAHETRSRIAVAIMAAAESGETNAARLKQAAIDRMF